MFPDQTWDTVRALWLDAKELEHLERPLTSQEVEMIQESVARLTPLVEERKAA